MRVPARSLALVITALLLVATPVTGAVGAAVVGDETALAGDGAGFAQTETETPANNETIQHEDPDSADEDGDSDSVQRWLENTLSSRLSESAIRIDQGQYEQGRELLGGSYDDTLGKYVEVAGETDGGDDDESAEEFRQARENQSDLAAETEEYRATVRAYREARQNGNETRARRLAREANRLAGTINRTVGSLNRTYETISNRTGVDVTETVRALESVERNVTTQQAEINEDLFEETEISASVAESAVSFANPTRLSGQLTLENGTALARQELTLLIGSQTTIVQTDADGRFTTQYRPTTVPLGPQDVSVTYLPTNESIYLASSTTISVTVSQTTPEISIDEAPQTVGFGDRVSITGRVTADGTGVETVPVVITLDGVRLGTVRTASDGTFGTTVSIPAQVRNGSRTLRTRVPLENKAIASANATRQVTVEPTATSLTLTGESRDGDTVRAAGRLTTQDGTPVADQRIQLLVGSERVGVAQTDADGRFNTTVSLAQSATEGDDSVTLAATYATRETSLESARATATVQVRPPGTGTGNGLLSTVWGISTNPIAWLLGLGALAATGVAYRRTRSDGTAPEGQATESGQSEGEATGDQPASTPDSHDQLLATARERLAEGDLDTAVEAAYAAVREQTAAVVDSHPSQTHWEWYAACEAAGLQRESLDALRDLTECYEQAAFAPGSLDGDRAENALSRADEVHTPAPQAD